MKNLKISAIALALLGVSVSAQAQITSTAQLFLGEKSSVNSCGDYGRLAKVSELQQVESLCDNMEPSAVLRAQGDDGSLWSVMGSNNNCEIKAGVSPTSQSICVVNDEAPDNTALLFDKKGYMGLVPFGGKPTIVQVGDKNPASNIHSVKVGKGVTLVGYTEEEYNGGAPEYTNDREQLDYAIRSYKLIGEDNLITFSFKAPYDYKGCLKVIAPSKPVQTLCSYDGDKELPLFEVPRNAGMINIAVYEERYDFPTYPVTTIGQFFLNFDGKGNFDVTGIDSLPYGLNIEKQGKNKLQIFAF